MTSSRVARLFSIRWTIPINARCSRMDGWTYPCEVTADSMMTTSPTQKLLQLSEFQAPARSLGEHERIALAYHRARMIGRAYGRGALSTDYESLQLMLSLWNRSHCARCAGIDPEILALSPGDDQCPRYGGVYFDHHSVQSVRWDLGAFPPRSTRSRGARDQDLEL